MRLGLRSSGLFLDCWLLLNVLSVHVGVQVDGLLVSRYNLICRGGCLSYMYSSRRLSSTDSNCNRKRELVSITAKKGERIEDSTGGNSGRNKAFALTEEGLARKTIGEENQVKVKDLPLNLSMNLGEGIQMKDVNETIDELLEAAQGPYSHTRVLVDSYFSSDGKFYEVFQDVQGEYIVGPVLRDSKWDVYPFNDPGLLAHIYKGVKDEFLKDKRGEEQEKERNDDVARKRKGLGCRNGDMNWDEDDDERFSLII